ncbi:MAG TPA: phospholipase D-like domain-containing protein [Ktedonobacteraceae bacterium]|nr:phospholipase D-like domain-containing protein [Ktedonobacteraceae bacterium]
MNLETVRRSITRILLRALGITLLLQVFTVLVLQVISMRRRRKHHKVSFEHPNLQEVEVGDNYLQIYDYGQDLYTHMLEAIEEARESIYLETYIWKGDEIGQQFKEALERKAAEGVEVCVIFDRFANLVVPKSFKTFTPDMHVLMYQSICKPWEVLDPRRFALDHRKLLVVDGIVGFIGGYNLGSLYATSWRDTHLRIQGPAAADIAQSFIDFWNQRATNQPPIKRHYARRFDPLINIIGTNAMRLTFPIRDMYIEAIDRAEHSIYLSNAYFVPDGILISALKAAAERGVDVCLLVPWISNHLVVDWLARGFFEECLKSGIRIFGYLDMLHAKTCTIDGSWSTIGTANLDRLSAIGNYEINAIIYDETIAHEMESLFNTDTKNAFEIKLEQWTKRRWYMKFAERLLMPFRIMS